MTVVRVIEVLICTAIILYFGTLRIPHFRGDELLSHDKILHSIAFGGQALVLYRCLCVLFPRHSHSAWALVAIGYATLLGAILEILQSMLPYRSMEYADLLADFIGAVLFVGVAKRYSLERPPLGMPW